MADGVIFIAEMFDLVNSADFYAMLVEDFDEFMAEPHSARRAVHCAITAYHLHEWVWHDWIENDPAAQESFGVRSRKSFLSWVNKRCVWFRNIADLANGTKHFMRDQRFDTARVVAGPLVFNQPTAGSFEVTWDGPFPYVADSLLAGYRGKGYLVLDFGEASGEQRWMPAAHLLYAVYVFWHDFFRKYRPAPDLPASRHHVEFGAEVRVNRS